MVSALIAGGPLTQSCAADSPEAGRSLRPRPNGTCTRGSNNDRQVDTRAAQVLIVDAEMATRFTLRRLFEGQGWRVTAAKSVEDAGASIHAGLDWIVIDPDLPDGDGKDVLALLPAGRRRIRIAILSRNLAAYPELAQFAPDIVMEKPVPFGTLFDQCAGAS